MQEKRHGQKIEDITLLSDTPEGGGRGDRGGAEENEGAAMHVHAHHQQNRQTHFLSVFSLWSTTARRSSRQKDLLHLNASGCRTWERQTWWRNMKRKMEKAGNIRRTVKEISGSVDGRMEGFELQNGMCERYPGETCKYVVIATWLLVM